MIALLAGLALAGTVQGTLITPEGEPLSGGYVAAYDGSLRQVAVDGPTGPDGAFSVDVPVGRIRLRVVPGNSLDRVETWVPAGSQDYCDAQVFQLAESEQVQDVQVSLQPGVSATGVLLGPDGAPVVGAAIEARPVVGASGGIQPRRGITTSDGRFNVVGLPPGRAWALRIDADDLPRQWVGASYQSLGASVVSGESGQRFELRPPPMLPGITVRGTASGPDGPLDGAVVTAFSEGQVASGLTQPDGTYTLRGLPPGSMTAWVDAEGHARVYWPSSVLPGERLDVQEEGEVVEDFDLQAPFESVVVGQLRGSGDLEGINVLLVHESGAIGLGAVTDASGAFTINEVPPGTWLLSVRAEEQGFLSGDIGGDDDPLLWTIPEGEQVAIEAELAPAVTFEGVISGADGKPAIDALVTVRSRATDVRYETRVAPDGSFLVGGLPGGDTWDLWAEGDPPCPNDPDRVRIYSPDTPDWLARVGLGLDAGDRVDWSVSLPDDADRDAMDDAWEEDVGLVVGARDASEDPDGDGVSNLVEYWEDSDPFAAPGRCDTSPQPAGWGLLGMLMVALRRRRR